MNKQTAAEKAEDITVGENIMLTVIIVGGTVFAAFHLQEPVCNLIRAFIGA